MSTFIRPLQENITYEDIIYPSVHNALAAQCIKNPIFKSKFTNPKMIPQDVSRLVTKIGLLNPLPNLHELLSDIYNKNNINEYARSEENKLSDIAIVLQPFFNSEKLVKQSTPEINEKPEEETESNTTVNLEESKELEELEEEPEKSEEELEGESGELPKKNRRKKH